jgi:hypothetical protein
MVSVDCEPTSDARIGDQPLGRSRGSTTGRNLLKRVGGPVNIKPLFGLGGVLIAAMTSEFNDQVTSIALTDIRGALGIGHDSGTWIESLYVSAEIVGMAISPWLAMTFTLRRWTISPDPSRKIWRRCRLPGNVTRRVRSTS